MYMSKRNIISFFIMSAIIALAIPINAIKASVIPTPILISADQTAVNYSQPLITGLSFAGMDVLVYIDGKYTGDAVVNKEGTTANNFYYQVEEPLAPGKHIISARAKERSSLALSDLSAGLEINVKRLAAPTLVAPNKKTITQKVKPLITGLSKSGTRVHVYIDGVYNGQTEILEHESGTANFAYKPFLNLSVGEHTVYTVAEDKFGNKSGKSELMRFNIEAPLPAPIIFTPVVNKKSAVNKPFIVGVVKSGLKVNVFIDKKLDGVLISEHHASGTASFAYQPSRILQPGQHLFYVSAVDDRGKESQWSNIIYYNIPNPLQPSISQEAASEEPVEVKGIEQDFSEQPEISNIEAEHEEEKAEPVEAEVKVIDQKSADEPVEVDVMDEEAAELEAVKDNEATSDISDILNSEANEEREDSGLINETKENQGKLKLNLVIFILFLIAVIIWIFWVNRELIKERQEQEGAEKGGQSGKKNKKNKNNQNTLDI